MIDNDIAKLFDDWNQAIQTRDPKQVAALYAADAVLLPTISNQVRHNHEEIEDYFVTFLANGPTGQINEANVRVFGDLAINSGVYTFVFNDGTAVQGRFTFVYRRQNARWMIVEHHSSQMPEG